MRSISNLLLTLGTASGRVMNRWNGSFDMICSHVASTLFPWPWNEVDCQNNRNFVCGVLFFYNSKSINNAQFLKERFSFISSFFFFCGYLLYEVTGHRAWKHWFCVDFKYLISVLREKKREWRGWNRRIKCSYI